MPALPSMLSAYNLSNLSSNALLLLWEVLFPHEHNKFEKGVF